MAERIQIVIDCEDPDRLAQFWQEALGYELQAPPEGHDSWESWLRANEVPEDRWNDASAVVDPAGAGPRIYFQRVPERKVTKNRLHIDVNVGRERIDEVLARLVTCGATVVKPPSTSEFGETWAVMADPEGNEFCLQ